MLTLQNKIIISTRCLSDDTVMEDYLQSKGAVVLKFPMIEIHPIPLTDTILKHFQEIKKFNWLVFTSKNGANYFLHLIENINGNLQVIAKKKIGVIGQKTAEEFLKKNIKPSFISSGNTSKKFLAELKKGQITKGDKILLILGTLANNTLHKGLSDIAEVSRINVYTTLKPLNVCKKTINIIINNKYDMIVFTSPSGVNNFLDILKNYPCKSDFKIACIGKTTANAALKRGIKPLVISEISNGYCLATAIEKYFI